MNNGSGDDTRWFKIKVGTHRAKCMNVRIAIFGQSRYLVRESMLFIKSKTKTAARMSGSVRIMKKFGLRKA